MSALYFTVNRRTDTSVLRLFGPITRETTAALRAMLMPYLGDSVELDLSNCLRLDLDGLLALAVFRQNTTDRGGAAVITAAPPLVEQYIRDHHMASLLHAPDRAGPDADGNDHREAARLHLVSDRVNPSRKERSDVPGEGRP